MFNMNSINTIYTLVKPCTVFLYRKAPCPSAFFLSPLHFIENGALPLFSKIFRNIVTGRCPNVSQLALISEFFIV